MNISIELGSRDILNDLIYELGKQANNMNNSLDSALDETGKIGAQMAKVQLGAYSYNEFPSEVANGIEYRNIGQLNKQIVSGGNQAVYTEYGSGIVGRNEPHPTASADGVIYDRNQHGQKGWYYKKNEIVRWTRGEPSKPYMHVTAMDTSKMVVENVIKHLKRLSEMVFIFEQVYRELSEVIKNFVTSDNGKIILKNRNVIVSNAYVEVSANFPVITIQEIDNSFSSKEMDNSEKFSRLSYEINIYDNDADARIFTTMQLSKLIDEYMSGYLGFARTACNAIPNLADAKVYRLVMRYVGRIDDETYRIYK